MEEVSFRLVSRSTDSSVLDNQYFYLSLQDFQILCAFLKNEADHIDGNEIDRIAENFDAYRQAIGVKHA